MISPRFHTKPVGYSHPFPSPPVLGVAPGGATRFGAVKDHARGALSTQGPGEGGWANRQRVHEGTQYQSPPRMCRCFFNCTASFGLMVLLKNEDVRASNSGNPANDFNETMIILRFWHDHAWPITVIHNFTFDCWTIHCEGSIELTHTISSNTYLFI